MHLAAIHKAFEVFLRERGLKLTAQRRRCLDRAFATHEHFSAERLYLWLKDEPGDSVSRATVYRTLSLLVEGGFLESLDAGGGELVYEHVLGHRHHDHVVCLSCGKIEEFSDERIEELQRQNCARLGFELVSHVLKLSGYCRACARKRRDAGVRDPHARDGHSHARDGHGRDTHGRERDPHARDAAAHAARPGG